ncbi:serine hydroxymethyltransferase [Actinosynnema sp. NPDC049800]
MTLERDDPELAGALAADARGQRDTLALVAHASLAHPSVLAAAGAALNNVTAEGYPGARYHPGAAWFDVVERLAVRRAKAAFGARYANVQPHSCSSANLSALVGLLPPGGVLLGMDLDAGGHLTHGSAASVTGTHFRAVGYGVDAAGRVDYDQVADLARRHRPGVVVAGASAHPRALDYRRFREIADSVGAYLLADISHVAGLVVAGEHPSPIDTAHVTTTSTYKQLGGPRGGLILIGAEHRAPAPDGTTTLAGLMQRSVFPRTQGTPNPGAIAAKARALDLAGRAEFREWARRVVADAAALAARLSRLGHRVLTGGTDTHMVVLDLRPRGVTGVVAERALEECGILANRNRVTGDDRPPLVASGLRLGTNVVARRGMGPGEAEECADLVDAVLRAVRPLDDRRYDLDPAVRDRVRARVAWLCAEFPVPFELSEVPA